MYVYQILVTTNHRNFIFDEVTLEIGEQIPPDGCCAGRSSTVAIVAGALHQLDAGHWRKAP